MSSYMLWYMYVWVDSMSRYMLVATCTVCMGGRGNMCMAVRQWRACTGVDGGGQEEL